MTKEEFERSSKSPALVRQSSLLSQSPPIGLSTNGEQMDIPESTNQQAELNGSNNKSLALMVQPSIDYGKFIKAISKVS